MTFLLIKNGLIKFFKGLPFDSYGYLRGKYYLFKNLFLKSVIWTVYFPPALFLSGMRYKVPNFLVSRIGHLMSEPDCILKEQSLGLMPKYRILMLASRSEVANKSATEFWKKYFTVIESPFLVKLLKPLICHSLTKIDISKYCFAINKGCEYSKLHGYWGQTPSFLSLSDDDIRLGRIGLEEFGIGPKDWYVCVHSRDGGYSPSDEEIHSFRNSNFNAYMGAINYIISIGGKCIVMGAHSTTAVPQKNGLIDYAHSPLKRDWMDLYISATCRFFLGNSSGAFSMASTFGIPVACANMAPMGAVYPGGIRDLGIPKLYRDIESDRLLSFSEILRREASGYRFASQFHSAGIELVENSSEDILDLAIELNERITMPHFQYSIEDDELQTAFRGLFHPNHYTYGSSSRVGRSFLKKYQNLLG